MQAVPNAHSGWSVEAEQPSPIAFSATHVPEPLAPGLHVPPVAHMTIIPNHPHGSPSIAVGISTQVFVFESHVRPSGPLHAGAVFAESSHVSPRPAVFAGVAFASTTHFPHAVLVALHAPVAHCVSNAQASFSASAPFSAHAVGSSSQPAVANDVVHVASAVRV